MVMFVLVFSVVVVQGRIRPTHIQGHNGQETVARALGKGDSDVLLDVLRETRPFAY